MIIQCTKTLLDKLKIDKGELASPEGYDKYPEGFYAWQANLITVDRRKVIVFMNNLVRYTIVLYRPAAKDYLHLEERLREGIRAAFAAEGVKGEIIEAYLENLGECRFSKTAGRSMVAQMNEICRQVSWFSEYMDEDCVIQDIVSLKMGRAFLNYGGKYKHPNEQLFGLLSLMTGSDEECWQQVREIHSYILKIKIDLENYDIWRRVQIPVNSTFAELHHVIQRVFGWLDYHLHEFSIVDGKDSAEKRLPLYMYPIKIRIVDGSDPEVGEYLEPDKYTVKYDLRTKLKDIFAETDKCLYTYDFGDSWVHEIAKEKEIICDAAYPVLLERQGERPPEDVGGETGFEEYMRIISDKNDPEYEFMTEWAEGLREEGRSIEEINRMMKR